MTQKFYGRSFDFKHLGKMFCVIRPDKGVRNKNGELVEEELYSWKKVNTAVVGIMLATVDNYGKMVVENHTTGDIITVDLKQRGWRASSAISCQDALDRWCCPMGHGRSLEFKDFRKELKW